MMPQPMIRLLADLLVLAALLALGATAATAAGMQSGNADSMAANVAALIAFIDGAPPTPAERTMIAADTSKRLAHDAAGTKRVDGQIRDFLSKLPHGDPMYLGDRREAMRFAVAELPQRDVVRRIVDAHDPTIAIDRVHHRIVTEATLITWRDGCTWLARLFNARGPDADFLASQRTFVRDRFASLPNPQQDAIANIERNYPVMLYTVEHLDKTKLNAAIAADQSTARDHADLPLITAALMQKSYNGAVNNIVINSILLGGGANYNMLYHRGYSSGIYR